MLLKRWNTMLEDLKRLQNMQNTLKKMKGGLEQCHKPYISFQKIKELASMFLHDTANS